MSDDDWFAPKRFGYGTGNPIAWQGWAVLGAYVAGLAVAGFSLLPRHWVLYAAMIVLLTAVLTIICAQHTKGGWRWRWGDD